jgi:ATP/maltotriose-dependent transcriptional regulator MalT
MLAAWASHVGAAWYTADSEDDALATFATGLLEALRPLIPTLPEAALGPAVAPRGPQTEERANAAALAALLSEILEEQLARDVVLVIDDFPETGAAGGPTRLIEGLCRQAPGHLHLVISSRTDLSFPMERLRGQGQVLELDASMLAMSESVVAELLAATLGGGAEGLAEPLHRLTAGWPAAVRLAMEALRNVPAEDRNAALQGLHRPEGPLFQYLAEEVFGREPQPVRDFLRRVAP